LARAGVALLLTFALLQGGKFFASPLTPRFCTMSCCVGKLPHKAGSCHAKVSEAARETGATGESCGTHGHAATDAHEHAADAHAESHAPPQQAHGHADSEETQTSPAQTPPAPAALDALSKPCPPDCSCGASNSAGQTRQRDSAAVSHARRPRPPSDALRFNFTSDLISPSSALLPQSGPRAPPVFLFF
jgi:hypothetical protein